ncbi:hypothetical protein JCM10207_000280 [Rhodosporidiobolus poonsookiae]
MDELRCNNLRCRTSLVLQGSAVVTTCSHIFCIDCANALFSTPQICPACETSLPDLDDVTQTTLNPHDSYKTSILSGLSPAVILDIASRALNFYTYQVQQEAAFQALITKNAQERISILEAQLNTLRREASAEIAILKERVTTSEKDLELERRRVRELQETHKANAKAYSKLKAQYDKAKQRALLNPGDPNLAGAFSAHPASGAPAPSPATTRQAFVPAPVNGVGPSRSNSTASFVPGGQHRGGGGGGGGGGWGANGANGGFVGQAIPRSASHRRPLHETNGANGGQGAFASAGGGTTLRKLNVANGTGHAQSAEGMPQFLGQGVAPSPRVTGGGGGRGGGGFRPAGAGGRLSG